MKAGKNIISIVIILGFSFFAIKPLLQSGFFPIHDDTQVARVYEMGKSLKDGMFPVRWVSDLGYGYGYPIFSFYAPLAYYIGGFLTLFGVDALNATKITMIIGIVAAGICMYFLGKQLWGLYGGLVSSILYLFAPYHAVDIYVRGDVGEFWAYAFIPLVFYGLLVFYRSRTFLGLAIGGIGYSFLILSHNLTSLMVTPFILGMLLIIGSIFYREKNTYRIVCLFLFLVLGMGISAFFWMPALLEMGYTNVYSQVGGGADYKDHFVCIEQFWSSQWGYGGSTKGCADGMSFILGKMHFLSIIFSVIAFFSLLKEKNRTKHLFYQVWIFLSLIGFSISMFFTLSISKVFWDTISFMAFFQYPWRFLVLMVFFSSVLGGSIIFCLENIWVHTKKYSLWIGCIFIFCVIFIYSKWFYPQLLLEKNSSDYTSFYSLRWFTSKISDEFMPQDFMKPQKITQIPQEKFSVLSEDTKITIHEDKTQKIRAEVSTINNMPVLLNIAYFPAWEVKLNGKATNFNILNRGIIVNIPSGNHIIEAEFRQTIIEQIANIVSLTSVILSIIAIIYMRKSFILRKT